MEISKLNRVPAQNKHIYIKTITLSTLKFNLLNQRIKKQYQQLKKKDKNFDIFYSWALCATILGIFSGYGNKESTDIFLNCVKNNKLPEITIKKNLFNVKITICVKKEL